MSPVPMSRAPLSKTLAAVLVSLAVSHAGVLETTGVVALRSRHPALTGQGVNVAQVEASSNASVLDFEVRPSVTGDSGSLFTYVSARGTGYGFPNSVGQESGHANDVAKSFYGRNEGVAPDVSQVFNYESDYFVRHIISGQRALGAKVVNQSFAFDDPQPQIDHLYDNYINRYHTIIVSGAGNGGAVLSPATFFNGIGVGAYGGSSSTGPTSDGRSKPDLTAPAGATSFSTPLVAGAAAVLVQTGRALGPNRWGAVDPRTIKAVLLNGAHKPGDWRHTNSAPLDNRYGAGVLNLDDSFRNLVARKHGPTGTTAPALGQDDPHFQTGPTSSREIGWDLRRIKSQVEADGMRHYVFELDGSAPFTLTSTLVWNRHSNRARVNNLDLLLFDAGGSLVAQSTSAVNNVEHLYLTGLASGTYDLAVVKHGGPHSDDVVSRRDKYALAWSFDDGSARAAAGRSAAFEEGAGPVTAVPEPSTFALVAVSMLLGAGWAGKRR